MAERITFAWLRDNLMPLVKHDADRAGEDVAGWALDRRGGGIAFVRLGEPDSETGVSPVLTHYRRFDTPAQADQFLQGLRWAYARAIDRRAEAAGRYTWTEVIEGPWSHVVAAATAAGMDTSAWTVTRIHSRPPGFTMGPVGSFTWPTPDLACEAMQAMARVWEATRPPA